MKIKQAMIIKTDNDTNLIIQDGCILKIQTKNNVIYYGEFLSFDKSFVFDKTYVVLTNMIENPHQLEYKIKTEDIESVQVLDWGFNSKITTKEVK